ncbi:MAG: matrixin family metalloprotease, partial [Planctomyces sp.]
MLISAWLTAVRNRLNQTRMPIKRRAPVRRQARLEDSLESRTLLAAPTLVAVRPNIGDFLEPNETLTVAPKELTLQFNPGQQIDSSNNRLFNNSPIVVTRSGRDGTFSDGNEVPVTLGYVGLGATSEDVVLRFAQNLADDFYRITIKGSGSNPLQNTNREVFSSGTSDPDGYFYFRLNLGAQVRAVVPQPIVRNSNGSLTQQRDQIVVYFNQDTLDTATAQNRNFYQLHATRNTVENTDEVVHLPTSVTYSGTTNTAVLTFAQPIDQLSGNGQYRLRIGTDEAIPLPPTTTSYSEQFSSSFGTTGAAAATVTIDPIVSIDGNPITLAFSSSALGTNGMPSITVNNRAITVVLDSVGGTTPSQLAWAMNLNTQVNRLVRTTIAGNQYTNLTLTSSNINFAFLDPGSSFGNSVSLGTLSSQSQIISGQILSRAYPFDFPGNGDEPGHRDINVPDETHLEFPLDQDPQITTYFYNFQRNYGFTPQGAPLSNLITENQKQRTREIFDLFSKRMGVQFVETANQGFTVVTGDLRAINPAIITGAGGVIGFSSRPLNLAIMDNAETWDDSYAGSWFTTAMHEIGHLLGLGHAYDLPELTVMGGFEGPTVQTTTAEPDFPGDADVIHGQALYRPESRDIDLYRFVLPKTGQFTAETIAERMNNASLLNTVIRLYREESGGIRTLIGQNDDYFSKDSQLSMELSAGTYFIGVSASGNDAYDPTIQDNGMYGTTQGKYDLRLNFRPNTDSTIRDAAINQPSLRLDGDHDGVEGGVYNFWFRAVDINRLRVVDKSMTAGGNIVNLYNRINTALAAAQPGDIVRIVGNGGTDGDVATKGDNVPFQIGLNDSGFELIDGGNMDIPKDVVVMIDAGAVFKMQGSLIGAGSSSLTVDRGGATLQILGTPFQDVTMTSWRDETIGGDTTPIPTTPKAGNWGGLVFRRDVDNAEGRINYERQGIFMDYVAFASIQYGGGKLDVDSVNQIVNPITMVQARPGIYFNSISRSEDSAMSADPDSFEETTFTAPAFQSVPFTPDYSRVGPDIYGNTLLNNSTNGLFIRIQTAPGTPTRQLTVAGRFDDRDIVHVIAENLSIKGSPGGPFLEVNAPPVVLVALSASTGGTLAAGTYNYRLVYVDAVGNQSPASVPTRNVTIAAAGGSVALSNLPPAIAPYTSRRLYRSDDTGGGNYTLIANLNASSTTFTDNGTTLTGILDLSLTGRNRARLDASLVIDPDMILKLEGARIEVGMGAQLIAEAVAGREIIVTSRLDDRYGAGGTFDTNNDDSLGANEISPSRTAGVGLWGGIYLAPNSSASIDRALVTFGGNVIPTDGNFAGFNVIEAHQAQLRVANSIFEQNRDGIGGTAPAGRYGRTANASGTIFARGAQPVIINNIFRDNSGPVLSINANAMTTELQGDYGRSTGFNDAFGGYGYNQGPLVVRNLLGRNAVNGIVVRGETLTTQSVWDDTDIVHVLQSEIIVPNFHTFGGLRLQSDPDASLVVKLSGASAGFTAAGKPLDIDDRIGGVLQIVGQPYFPVILTSLADDTVGAGFGLDGLPLKDTNNNGASTGSAGAWRSVLISQYAHDRNVAVYGERESLTATAPGSNATAFLAEFIGELGRQNFIVQNADGTTTTQNSSDDNLRMGFEIHGVISAPNDVDVYSFSGTAGSEVWIDIDRTTHSLDTVVELISSTGTIIALSDNSLDEESNPALMYRQSSLVKANPLSKSQYLSDDLYGTNQKDAGFRVILPGVTGTTGTYQVRVRSSNIDSLNTLASRADLIDSSKVFNGLTSGGYQLQIRLQETDEVPGTVVRYSDIRFATNGIEVYGQPVHSPLAGEYAESTFPNDTALASGNQDVGNILNTDKAAVSISGRISAPSDVDFYRFSITYDDIQQIPGHTNPLRFASVTFDVDYADGMSRANLDSYIFNARTNTLILTGSDSNIAEDRGGALEGADMDDLSRGSVGQYDPYIGPFELPEGDYYLVVAPHGQIPAVLAQTMIANPVSTATRIEPLPVVQRIFDAHFGGQGTLSTPQYQFGDGEQGQNVVQYHLGDVLMFSSGGNTIQIKNPFTGTTVNTVGITGSPHAEIQMRPDGELFGWRTTGGTDAATSTYFRIDTGTAAVTDLNDDGIGTFNFDANGNAVATNVGTIVTAFTYTGTGDTAGRMVAQRGDAPAFGYSRNILYQFNIRTGVAVSNGPARTGNARANGPAGTDIVELGVLPTQGNGIISGLASRDGINYFAVDNTGRLYQYLLLGGVTSLATIRYFDQNNNPVVFTGLSYGPSGVEGGAYANMLFASDAAGNLRAISTGPNVIDPNAVLGDLAPIFVDGQTVLQTGGTGAGITFGTLQRNLWALTSNRNNDPGHGLTPSIDGTRDFSPGGASLYFGNQATGATAGNKNDLGLRSSLPDRYNYNFPGGAHGTYLSNPFSLEGYSAADKPVLYFNYFLSTESRDYNDGTPPQADAIRVYVGDGTNWSLAATNNSTRLPQTGDDEQDLGPNGVTSFPDGQLHRDVVEL